MQRDSHALFVRRHLDLARQIASRRIQRDIGPDGLQPRRIVAGADGDHLRSLRPGDLHRRDSAIAFSAPNITTRSFLLIWQRFISAV